MFRPVLAVLNAAAWVGDRLLSLVPDDLFDVRWDDEDE